MDYATQLGVIDTPPRLSPTQRRRKQQLLRAARKLAEQGGYKAVTIAAVAEYAGTTRVTVYHYFTNRDHMLAEVVLQWSIEVVQRIKRAPLHGETLAEQVGYRFEELVRRMWQEPRLVDSVLATFVSARPGTIAATSRLHGLISLYLSSVLRDPAPQQHPEVERAIGHLFFSVLLNLCTGRLTLEAAIDDLKTGLTLIIRE